MNEALVSPIIMEELENETFQLGATKTQGQMELMANFSNITGMESNGMCSDRSNDSLTQVFFILN